MDTPNQRSYVLACSGDNGEFYLLVRDRKVNIYGSLQET
jgi:hypothetical protein